MLLSLGDLPGLETVIKYHALILYCGSSAAGLNHENP
jgi:hypothetical protein